MQAERTPLLELEGHTGKSRYWRVVTGESPDHPDAKNAAVHAAMTGSVGCTYNGVRVQRADIGDHDGECAHGRPMHKPCAECGVGA